jgi:hypothetical protein
MVITELEERRGGDGKRVKRFVGCVGRDNGWRVRRRNIHLRTGKDRTRKEKQSGLGISSRQKQIAHVKQILREALLQITG